MVKLWGKLPEIFCQNHKTSVTDDSSMGWTAFLEGNSLWRHAQSLSPVGSSVPNVVTSQMHQGNPVKSRINDQWLHKMFGNKLLGVLHDLARVKNTLCVLPRMSGMFTSGVNVPVGLLNQHGWGSVFLWEYLTSKIWGGSGARMA